MGRTWTDDDAKSASDRAVDEVVAVATALTGGRAVTGDSAMSAEVRRRDAEMWAHVGSRGERP